MTDIEKIPADGSNDRPKFGASGAAVSEPPIIDHQPAPDAPASAKIPPPPARRGGAPFGLTLLFVLALGGGIYYVWTNPKPAPPDTAAIQAAVAAQQDQLKAELQQEIQAAKDAASQAAGPLHDQIAALAERVDKLEKAPPPAAPPSAAPPPPAPPAPAGSDDLAALTQHVDQLAAKVDALSAAHAETPAAPAPSAAAPEAPPPDHAALDAAAQAAANAQAQVAALGTKVDQAEQEQKAALTQTADQEKAALEQQKTALEQEKAALEQTAAQQKAALDALNGRLDKLEQGTGKIQSVADMAARAARLDEVQAALSAGRPIGELPGAPPALARFAKTAPPTDAALQAAFPAVAEQARAVSQPQTAHEPFWTRVLARMQQIVVVRRGDDVIVGDPAAGILARATDAVNRDDLAGAVTALAALQGPAAQAVSGWVAQARSLLDARAALVAMSMQKTPVQ